MVHEPWAWIFASAWLDHVAAHSAEPTSALSCATALLGLANFGWRSDDTPFIWGFLVMQLERLLQNQGFGSRKESRNLIRAGRVTFAGAVCCDPYVEVDPLGFTFAVDDEPWQYREQVYLALNKPVGYECSHRPQYHRSVFSLLLEPLITRGVQCVGRLDEDTTGLLLLSDDGQFIHSLSSPKRKVSKVYEVHTKHAFDHQMIETLLAGVVLHDNPEPVQALACVALDECSLRLTIAEGRYHQVKRMIAAAGNRVESLRRVAVGGFSLPTDLAEGQWCWLEAADIAHINASTYSV